MTTRQQDMTMPFGGFKGDLIADLPCSYLGYLRDQDWFILKFKDLYDQVIIETEYRKKFDIVIE